jgi:hypothetical protein
MPHSDHANKDWVLDKIKEINPKSILDVGVGAGVLESIVRPLFGNDIVIHGIEAWQPYISEYDLENKYDKIFNIDAREWHIWDYDLVMFGDVLEHMIESESVKIWDEVATQASNAIITIPIIHYPQGAAFNNPYEIHHEEDWNTDRILNSFKGIVDHKEFEITGAYLARFKDEALSK